MSKETSQPKAVNIIRPSSGGSSNNILYNSHSHSSSGSTTSNTSRRTTGSLLSATSTNSARKPRVAGTSIVKSSMEKPILNLYHPPSRKPSYDNNNTINSNSSSSSSKRPTIELYKPPSQQKMTKSYTAPSLTLPNDSKIHTSNNNIHYNRPISPSYIRPQPSQQQQAQQYHRSVLGVINTPVAAASPATATIHTSPSDIVNKSTSSPLIIDNHQKPEDLNPTSSRHLDQDREDALADDFVLADETAENDEMIEMEDDPEYNDDEDEGESDEDEEDDEEEEPVINEARVNRKIADLELSINSLLTVNAMLEATVRKQALQLSQIKKQQSAGDGGAAHIDFLLDPHQEEVTDQTDQEDDEDDWESDALFQKLRKVTEHMIEQGQKSIDFEYKILGRVLSNYNAMDEDAEDEDEEEDEEEEGESAEEQTETASDQGTTHNGVVAEQDRINSNAEIKAPPPLFRNNTFESSKKASSSIPRNVSKFTRKKAAPKSQSIHIST